MRSLPVILVVLSLPVLACGGGSRDAKLIGSGREHYQQTCALCHGASGQGKAMLGKDLRGNAFTESLSDDDMMDFLRAGRPSGHPLNERGVDMPPRGGNPNLTDDDLREIVAFLRTL